MMLGRFQNQSTRTESCLRRASTAPPGLVYCNGIKPMAYAMGYFLSPLRG